MIEENGIRRRMTEEEIHIEARRRTVWTLFIISVIVIALCLPTMAQFNRVYEEFAVQQTATAQAPAWRP
jgi:hypothetical protein